MSIQPPAQKIWWKEPIHKIEAMWVVIALVWCLILFLWMPYWHVYGKQNLSNEAYRVHPDKYMEKVDAFTQKYKVGTETEEQIAVVAPPAGSDIYMQGGGFRWTPILKLKKDQKYRLHLSSIDVQHGFSLQPTNINLQILPGYETVLTIQPDKAGTFGVVCNEYCGLGHHQMLGKIIVE